MDFVMLPPEINSARMFAGTGSATLLTAAAAWDGLAAELSSSASSFESVVTGTLASGSWTGPAALVMSARALRYAQWLSATAAQAEESAVSARTAAAVFDAAQAATVQPALVAANRALLAELLATNVLGQNVGAIAATEAEYGQMWAQDVTAMFGYQAGVASLAATVTPFTPLPEDTAAPHPWGPGPVVPQTGGGGGAGGGLSSLLSGGPMMMLSSVGEFAMMPAEMLISPLTSMGSMGSGAAAPAAAGIGMAAGAPAVSSGALAATKPLGAVSAGLGKAGALGALSVPDGWASAAPAAAAAPLSAGVAPAAATALPRVGAAAGGAGMPMMTMPGGMAGAGAADFGGRAGAGCSALEEARPTIVPRLGVG